MGKHFIDRRTTKMSTYWCKDEMGSFYIIRKSLLGTDGKGRYINKIQEAFVCVPLSAKSDSCALYFFSEFNYATQGNIIAMNNYV